MDGCRAPCLLSGRKTWQGRLSLCVPFEFEVTIEAKKQCHCSAQNTRLEVETIARKMYVCMGMHCVLAFQLEIRAEFVQRSDQVVGERRFVSYTWEKRRYSPNLCVSPGCVFCTYSYRSSSVTKGTLVQKRKAPTLLEISDIDWFEIAPVGTRSSESWETRRR
jgi:hypothetical protein